MSLHGRTSRFFSHIMIKKTILSLKRLDMATDNLGSIVSLGNVLRIDNAVIDEVFFSNNNTGYILISYSVPWQSGINTTDQLQLNVNNNTVILNSFRLPICLCDLREGMRVDVTFSSRMTRSIPPQSNAFSITVRRPSRPPVAPPSVTTVRILWIDANNNRLITVSQNNINRQMVFVITNSTIILNRNGFPIPLRALRPGQLVQISHSNFQTASIPPIATAFRIQVI